jgi:hypothetical protein
VFLPKSFSSDPRGLGVGLRDLTDIRDVPAPRSGLSDSRMTAVMTTESASPTVSAGATTPAVPAVAAAPVMTADAMAAMVSAIPTASMMAAIASVVAGVCLGGQQPINHEGRASSGRVTLVPEPGLAQDIPDDRHAPGDEPDENRLRDLL